MLKFVKSGFFTSVQDSGRFGYRNKGVPVAGVMDGLSSSIVNMLLDNDAHAPLLEITMTGPELLFEEETYIAMGGAEFSGKLNDNSIKNYKAYKVVAGDRLYFGNLTKGFRAYLGVKDGFQAPKVLGSSSLYKPITPINHFKDSDVVPYARCKSFHPKIQEVKVDLFLDETVLEVHKGPEYGLLTDKQLELLFFKSLSIAKENDRMAYQINENIDKHQISMLTSATLPGTVQLTPSGKLIVLMKDGQTTGGYPRILQLSDRAISILAQKRSSDTVSFRLI